MSEYNYTAKSHGSTTQIKYDEGLRQYFLKIYALMSTGLAITAITGILVYSLQLLLI